MSKQFYFKQFSLALEATTPSQSGPGRIKGFFAFPKAPALLEPHRQIV